MTWIRRFNTHVSALFFHNHTLREHYVFRIDVYIPYSNLGSRMLGDIRDLIQRYGSGDHEGRPRDGLDLERCHPS